jgi:hypothetical protein
MGTADAPSGTDFLRPKTRDEKKPFPLLPNSFFPASRLLEKFRSSGKSVQGTMANVQAEEVKKGYRTSSK